MGGGGHWPLPRGMARKFQDETLPPARRAVNRALPMIFMSHADSLMFAGPTVAIGSGPQARQPEALARTPVLREPDGLG
jgi:hypothetical protein